jgi:hypothetical protein
MGNGEEIPFWKDRWLEGDALCICFNRFFKLAFDKNITVAEMCRMVWVVGSGEWR